MAFVKFTSVQFGPVTDWVVRGRGGGAGQTISLGRERSANTETART